MSPLFWKKRDSFWVEYIFYLYDVKLESFENFDFLIDFLNILLERKTIFFF